jgi:hypothetical protein
MIVFCTYCSKEKSNNQGDMPALARYDSERIKKVYNAAEAIGYEFRILSGKFGLLAPFDQIPYYDHLLKSSEVNNHAKKVSFDLIELQADEVIFFTDKPDTDPNLKNYIECMQIAVYTADAKLKIIYLP